MNLSGGQKQRLCIARAMLKQPKILILDDSTSAVDSATEARIRESFYHNLAQTTIFIIAQRISSVRDADKIIVLDDGKIVGVGTHRVPAGRQHGLPGNQPIAAGGGAGAMSDTRSTTTQKAAQRGRPHARAAGPGATRPL